MTRADPGEVSAAEAYLLFYVADGSTAPDPKPPEAAEEAGGWEGLAGLVAKKQEEESSDGGGRTSLFA